MAKMPKEAGMCVSPESAFQQLSKKQKHHE
jgi:hypothetical protein